MSSVEPRAWYATISDWEGLPHPGNVETWNGVDYIVQSVTNLDHGPDCWCGKGAKLVQYRPLSWNSQSESWKHQRLHRDAATIYRAIRDCDEVHDLTYEGPVAPSVT